MKILITGSTGMVGKNLIETLNQSDLDLKILSPLSFELNLVNYNNVLDYLKLNKPDFVIHCAGRVGGIQANMQNPYAFLVDNLYMGMNLVKASKEIGVPNLLNLSSSCSYPKFAQNPLSEEQILSGTLEPTNEGYALAKIAVLKMCDYITQQENNYYYKTFIPCNLYGKWDKFSPHNSHMIPGVIRKLHDAKVRRLEVIDIWGDGEARREFMYAEDLADCIHQALLSFEKLPNIMNIGIGYDYSINEYYETIKEIVGYSGKFEYDLTKPVGVKQKLLNTQKQKNWGWQAKTSLQDGIKKTYDYYMKEIESKCTNIH